MNPKKVKLVKKKPVRRYARRVSLYPLKPEEALSAFMRVDPKKIRKTNRKKP